MVDNIEANPTGPQTPPESSEHGNTHLSVTELLYSPGSQDKDCSSRSFFLSRQSLKKSPKSTRRRSSHHHRRHRSSGAKRSSSSRIIGLEQEWLEPPDPPATKNEDENDQVLGDTEIEEEPKRRSSSDARLKSSPNNRRRSTSRSRKAQRRPSSEQRRHSSSRNHSPSRYSRRRVLEDSRETSGSASAGRSKRRVTSERHLTSPHDGSWRNLTASGGRSRRKLPLLHSTSNIISQHDEEEDVSTTAKNTEDDAVKENRKVERRKLKILAFLVLLVLLTGAVFSILILWDNTDEVSVGMNRNPSMDDVSGPSVGNNKTPPPTVHGTSPPSMAPSFQQIYDPPNQNDCDKIRMGLPVDGQDEMDTKLYELEFDVTTSDPTLSKQVWVPAFQEGIDEALIPLLLGCSSIVPNRRRLSMWNHPEAYPRKLQSIDSKIRYLIGNAKASTIDSNQNFSSNCEIPNKQDSCSRVNVQLRLYLKGEERGYAILSLIIQVISYLEALEHDNRQLIEEASSNNYRKNSQTRKLLERILGLNLGVFEDVTFRGVNRVDPTNAPSIAPSRSPSTIPSSQPSKDLSAAPSFRPSPPPTPRPTPSPTRSPTTLPTPPPTRLTTLPPTRFPTSRPTPRPTPRPTTKSPTSRPTASPTSRPTIEPTTCEDDKDFVDPIGGDCQWYTNNELPGCPLFGQQVGPCRSSPTGQCSATEACCQCQLPAPPPTSPPTSGPTTNCIDDQFLDVKSDNCTWYEDNDSFGCLNFGDTLGICASSSTGFCTATQACCHCSRNNPPPAPCTDNPTFRDDLFLEDCTLFSQIDPDCSENGTDPGTCTLLLQPFTCSAMAVCCHCSQDPFCTDDQTFQDDNGDCQWYTNNDSVGCPNFGNLYSGTCFPTVTCTPEEACCHCQ